jgi:UDP-N-acetylglucosamine transferase subunit ALG13
VIFVAVGTQLPFDRLVKAVDQWAGTHHRKDVFAQIGPSHYRPVHLEWREFVDAHEFKQRVAAAEVVVAHAGMGSIITALELGKTIIVMPRRADLNEHRNDHQLATARQFQAQGRISVAFDEAELTARLEALDQIKAPPPCATTASPELLQTLRDFLS